MRCVRPLIALTPLIPGLFAQVRSSASTDSSVSHYVDSVRVTVSAANVGNERETPYPCDCDIEYVVDHFNLLGHRGRTAATVPYVVSPRDFPGRTYLHPCPVAATHSLPDEACGDRQDCWRWIVRNSVSGLKYAQCRQGESPGSARLRSRKRTEP